ncbi:hypothetical protein E2C01_048775 [Portunus trituberculatus]|uniref:CUB domain-containing protein n=1 Tax=Portunus trituberculatus TaxID=210409 RepID=A0A5B7GBF2_PORTR|nr:hypothetical protein [Portunus trituberculatus]
MMSLQLRSKSRHLLCISGRICVKLAPNDYSVPYGDPPKRTCLWRFASASSADLTRYYADFPWNNNRFRVRDSSLCAERITEKRG